LGLVLWYWNFGGLKGAEFGNGILFFGKLGIWEKKGIFHFLGLDWEGKVLV